MEEEGEGSSYWCHMCSQMVNPVTEMESLKCPICLSGFVEELASNDPSPETDDPLLGMGGERALSLWAPVLLGMMTNPPRRRRHNLRSNVDDDGDVDEEEAEEIDRELNMLMRTRRRSTAAIVRLLQNGRSGVVVSESVNSDTSDGQIGSERDEDDHREREDRVILVNPFNQTIIVQDSSSFGDNSGNRIPVGSLGDYFMGPGMDLLMQQLAENDPNRYGTPPANKEAVESLATVNIKEILQCCVCLDECEVGTQVKEMPCKHKFHSKCILPWLQLHSSCPVCRYQLPSDEPKLDPEGLRRRRNISNISSSEEEENNNQNGTQISVPLPWPFSNVFSLSGSHSGGQNSSSTAQQPSSSTDAPN